MDHRRWISDPSKRSEAYIQGVLQFLDFAFQKSAVNGKILCPCVVCVNLHRYPRSNVYEHLTNPRRGFLKGYKKWIFHGETYEASTSTNTETVELENDMHGLLHDIFGMPEQVSGEHMNDVNEEIPEQVRGEHCEQSSREENSFDKFHQLIKEAEQKLYPNCEKYTKLSFILHLYHIKCLHGWSDKSFSMLLELLRDVLPEGNILPKSYYDTKKLISGLGLGYEKIYACPNDCMLYWKDKRKDEVCSKCGVSRWKTHTISENNEGSTSERKKIPAKILRWFPLIPRLKRLFMSSKTASFMRWHEEGRTKDSLLRHPADSLAWKKFNSMYPDFSSDPRNVRLGLASDGFNPFKTMSVTHSTWPVIVIPYNFPPWMCMKQPSFMMSLLIPGPKGPDNNIDVYLQPLVEELKELWEIGVETFDAHKKESFRMHAALIWTINDYPAYANLSGWSTKGRYACPCCGFETASQWLNHSRKFCYMCHRRWLEPEHKWRYNHGSFDGTQEFRGCPIRYDGDMVLRQLEELEDVGAIADGTQPWKKKSILFTLPYWKHNVLRHNLDVLHIEKNVCDNIIGTLLNQEGKSKDNYKARADLVDMNIRNVLHPQTRLSNGLTFLPRACYQMTKKEKEAFLTVLKNIKAPDECSSNIPRCVQIKQLKLVGLKSYDCHVLMQEFMPKALKGSLPDKVTLVLIDLCRFFKEICSKVLNKDYIEQLESKVAKTLCQLETIFPPSFFTIMVHLIVHLAYEAQVGGPVHYRWMYLIERYLCTLKSFVRNRAQPEGSIAEGYLAHESLTMCSRYLTRVETRFNRPSRNDDESYLTLMEDSSSKHDVGRPLGRKRPCKFNLRKRKRLGRVKLDKKTLLQAHRYVLFNNDAITPFREEHCAILKGQRRPRRLTQYEVQRTHSQTFNVWFRERIARLEEQQSAIITDELKWLSRGPSEVARRYTGYLVNGFRFHTQKRERCLTTQNSGIVVIGDITSYSSARDTNGRLCELNYYGALTDVIELDYSDRYKKVLFKCNWVDPNRGCKVDKFGMTLVNFNYLKHTSDDICDDPFIFASQAQKVFYVEDKRQGNWLAVVNAKVRDMYDMGDEKSNETEQMVGQSSENATNDTHTEDKWIREVVDDDEPLDIIPNVQDDLEDIGEEDFF